MFLKVENKSQWRSLSDKAFFKTFFHSSDWEDFLEKEFFWIRFEHYVWRNEALLSIARCRMFGREKLVSHPFCEYGGPLPLAKNINSESFISDFRQFFGEKAKIKFHPGILGVRDCSPAHSRQPSGWLRGSACFAEHSTALSARTVPKQASNPLGNNPVPPISSFLIEDYSKKSVEDLWLGLRKTLRHEIKKGEGLHIAECDNEKDLNHFYDIYVKTVIRHKNIPLPFSVFKFFNDSQRASVVLAKKGSIVVGGSVFLFYQPFIHYFINASDKKFRSAHIGHTILWHAMQEYVGHEYDYFDLGGTRRGSALEVFKRGWGAKEYPLYEIGGSAVKSADSPYRNVLGFIPPACMKHFATLALWAKI